MPLAAVVLAVAVNVGCALNARYPMVPLDEIVMVGNSRVLSMVEQPWSLGGQGFMPGLALLVAPAWWFTDDAVLVYRVGIWVAVALALLAIWPLSRIVRWAGASTTASVTIAAAVSCAPSRALLSNYLLAESLLLLATAILVVVSIRFFRRPSSRNAVILGISSGFVFLSHGRGIAILGAVGATLLIAASRRWIPVKPMLIAAAVGVASSALAYRLFLWVNAQTLALDGRVDAALAPKTLSSVSEIVAGLIGQGWYAALAWPAIAVAGVALVAKRLTRDPVALLIAGMVGATLVISAWQSSPAWGVMLADQWFYGRYMDTMWVIVAAIGLAVLIKERPLWFGTSIVAVTAVIAIAMAGVVGPTVPTDGEWRAMHVLGVAPWMSESAFDSGEPQNWWVLAGLTIGLTAVVVGLSWLRRPSLVVAVLALPWATMSLVYDAGAIDVSDGDRRDPGEVFGLWNFSLDTPIGVDPREDLMWNVAQFASPTRVGVFEQPFVGERTTPVFLAFWQDERYADAGARIVVDSVRGDVGLVVFPGPLQDALSDAALLEPQQ